MGLEAVSDFASIFKETDYEDKCGTVIVDNTTDKDNVLALGRLRTAWTMARADLNKAATAVATGSTEHTDWDEPLKEHEETKRKTEWDAAYDALTFSEESTPAATIIARFYREFHGPKRLMSICALKRMRSEADYKTVVETTKTPLGDGVKLIHEKLPRLPDIEFRTVLQMLLAFRLMTNGWAMTGTSRIDSKVKFDAVAHSYAKVREIHLSQAIAYYDFIVGKCIEHPGNAVEKIKWILERDRQTRSKARAMFTAGRPFAEALTHSREVTCQVLWTCGAPGVTRVQIPVLPQQEDVDMDDEEVPPPPWAPPRARVRKPRKAGGKQASVNPPKKPRCEKFNSPEGCTPLGRNCPLKKAHLCSKCGNWSHGASTCRKR